MEEFLSLVEREITRLTEEVRSAAHAEERLLGGNGQQQELSTLYAGKLQGLELGLAALQVVERAARALP